MRILGIDYGTKRIGIALSDEGGTIAFPKEVLENSKNTTDRIAGIAHEAQAGVIVVGESKDWGGRENPLMGDIRSFKKSLEDKDFTVVLEPEFFSSVEAGRFQGVGEKHDASAAAIILQRYLDKQKHT